MIGIVAVADSYEYIQGILCYIVENRPKRWLRILDLHRSASHELVIDIPALTREAVPRCAKSRKYKFRVLYHSSGITSCLLSFALPAQESWLIIFKAEEHRILTQIRLDSTTRLFVRNNENYLYYGTHSDEGADGFRKWVLTLFYINDTSKPLQKIHLEKVVGYDIGSTVCFEIIDDYFYGLSNQTDFEIRETNWESYYYCFRFPLHEPDVKKAQTMRKEESWRRQHFEGPIDDRWGLLKLQRDEASGEINIIECRKEWLTGLSGSRRTYYITRVVFHVDLDVGSGSETSTLANNTAIAVPVPVAAPATRRNIRYLDRGYTTEMQTRQAADVHPGDSNSVTLSFTRSQTHLSSYQRCCNAWLDLVDDAHSESPDIRRLRLRSGYRKRRYKKSSDGMPNVDRQPELASSSADPRVSVNWVTFLDQIDQQYEPNKIYFWPPEQRSPEQKSFLNEVYNILNPSGHHGSVTSSSDERSVVYATGVNSEGCQALVYVSFDPAARLSGMLPGEDMLGVPFCSESKTNDEIGYNTGTTKASRSPIVPKARSEGDAPGGPARQLLPPYIPNSSSMHTVMPHPRGNPWARVEKAMHQDLARAFSFAR